MSYLYTRTTPTATQTRAFANANPTIMPTAGSGSFRSPGVRAWQAIARSFMPFFRWWRGIVPFNAIVGQTPVNIFTHVNAQRFQSNDALTEPCLLLHMVEQESVGIAFAASADHVIIFKISSRNEYNFNT